MSHHIIILIVCVGIAAAMFMLNADETGVYCCGFELPVRCPLHEIAGMKCSLCGLTRSICLLAHGNFFESLKLHPIGPAIFAFIVLQIPYRIWAIIIYPGRIEEKLAKANTVLFVTLLAAVFINWIVYLGGLVR